MESKIKLLSAFRSHANLPGYDSSYVGLGMALSDWRRRRVRPDLALQVREVIRLLQVVVSSRGDGAAELSVQEERTVGYAMSLVVSDLTRELIAVEPEADDALKAGFRWALAAISYAWTCVLAGDIDDLLTELEHVGLNVPDP
jgi:hypothetical protein